MIISFSASVTGIDTLLSKKFTWKINDLSTENLLDPVLNYTEICLCHTMIILSTVSDLNCTTVCLEDFYLDETVGYCRPHCGRWKAYPPTTQTVQDAFVIMSAAGGIIAAIIVITLAYFRHKNV